MRVQCRSSTFIFNHNQKTAINAPFPLPTLTHSLCNATPTFIWQYDNRSLPGKSIRNRNVYRTCAEVKFEWGQRREREREGKKSEVGVSPVRYCSAVWCGNYRKSLARTESMHIKSESRTRTPRWYRKWFHFYQATSAFASSFSFWSCAASRWFMYVCC